MKTTLNGVGWGGVGKGGEGRGSEIKLKKIHNWKNGKCNKNFFPRL